MIIQTKNVIRHGQRSLDFMIIVSYRCISESKFWKFYFQFFLILNLFLDKDGKDDKFCCIGIDFHIVRHDGKSFRPSKSTDEILGNYTFCQILNGRPKYQSNFDDGKFSIWSCNNCWVVGYTEDVPKCKGIAYRYIGRIHLVHLRMTEKLWMTHT